MQNFKKTTIKQNFFLCEFCNHQHTFAEGITKGGWCPICDKKNSCQHIAQDGWVCSRCNKANSTPIKTIEKEVDAIICPFCDNAVPILTENYNLGTPRVIICPECMTYLNDDWDIFNFIESHNAIGFDHKNYKNGIITLQPYSVNPHWLKELIELAECLGYKIEISGTSTHHPDCLTITIKNREKTPENTEFRERSIRLRKQGFFNHADLDI